MRPLEFGWYLPTHGDTTAYGPGYINPVLMAKMISTFDQMSGGRICINLIAGQNESEVEAEGVRYAKEERYALMEEEVSILKAIWTTSGAVHFQGKFHSISGAHVRPKPLQKPYPKFYLGGGSRQAWEMSAKHSDVHLFWGDLPDKIAENIVEIRQLARGHGRENEIGFGMRLQIICREDEKDAWEAADQLVRHATDFAHAGYDGRESSSALVARDLRGQHVARRLDIDQRIDVKFGRYDIGPFVQDAVKLVVAFDIEHGGRATADARIDMLADTRSLVSADPGPEALPLRGDFGWAFGARRRDHEKQGGHDELLRGIKWRRKVGKVAPAPCPPSGLRSQWWARFASPTPHN
jgi:hypothetical protein